MRLILCDDKNCVHNTDKIINNTRVSICSLKGRVIIDNYTHICDKYENVEAYIKRIYRI